MKGLNGPYEQWMRDWPLEISHHIDLASSIHEYSKLIDDDEKFLLMKGILYALDEAESNNFEVYKQKVIELVKVDFDLHKFTIYHWALYGEYPDESNEFTITPLMRDVWNSKMR